MSTQRLPGILSFEDVTDKLEWLPMAARRALDAVGVGVSLASWQALDLGSRKRFVELGSAAVVDEDGVRAELARVDTWTPREPRRETEAPSPALLGLLAELAEPLSQAWRSLAPLGRYALGKMAESTRRPVEEKQRRLHEAASLLLQQSAPELLPGAPLPRLSHVNTRGEAHMVDVRDKPVSARVASASAQLLMQPATLAQLAAGQTKKGDVLATARIAGIQAAKRTAELIPLCHNLALSGVELELTLDAELPGVRILATVRTVDRTGVEMEALVAASVAGLTLYDMLKAVDRDMRLTEVRLETKSGGRSGDYQRGAP